MMRYIVTISLLMAYFFCVYPTQAEEGYVITADNGQIYLNLGEKHGVEIGTLFRVYRPLFNIFRPEENATIDIGKIKVTHVSYEASVASILSQENDMEIMAGDRIEIIPPDKKSENQLAPPQLILPKLDDKPSNHKIHRLFLQTGIAALGCANYFRQLADNSYSKYRSANSSDSALSYRQKTELNDKRAKISLAVSLALIGVSAYLWQEGDTVTEHHSSVSFLNSHLKPYVSYNKIGWKAKF